MSLCNHRMADESEGLLAGTLNIGELARKIQNRIEVNQREIQAKEVVLRALRGDDDYGDR